MFDLYIFVLAIALCTGVYLDHAYGTRVQLAIENKIYKTFKKLINKGEK